jgi:uncharacterized protein (TIGR02594 family)
VRPLLPETKWLEIARAEIGQREQPGIKTNPRILEYFEAALYLRARMQDEVPWCAAFVCWCLESADVRSTRSARAANYATWGEPGWLVPGAVVVFSKADPDAGGSGHVAFCAGLDGADVLVLGGNQADAVSIARRPLARIVAVRWPVAA